MRLVWVQTRDVLQICDSREVCIRFGFLTILDLRPCQITSKIETYML